VVIYSSYEIINNKQECNEDIVLFTPKNRQGGVENNTTLHETFPPPVPSDTLSLGRLAYETSDLNKSRAADLVHQPSRWGAELPRAIRPNTGGCKASLISSFLPTFKHPISSSYLNNNGMELLSDRGLCCRQHP